MPLHDFMCPIGHITEAFVRNGTDCVPCKCGKPAAKVFLKPSMVAGDYEGYTCPVTGDWIEGRKAHQENLMKHNCRLYESGEKEEYLRRKAADDVSFDKSIDSTLDEEFSKMPARKLELLEQEVRAGADVVVERS